MLRIRQKAALSGFHHQAFDVSEMVLTDLERPNVAQANNAVVVALPPTLDLPTQLLIGLMAINAAFR